MPKFKTLEPESVLIGRARLAAIEREAYIEAVQAGDAGSIELDRTENPTRVKRLLSEAANHANKRIRSSWEDKNKRVLLWRVVGS